MRSPEDDHTSLLSARGILRSQEPHSLPRLCEAELLTLEFPLKKYRLSDDTMRSRRTHRDDTREAGEVGRITHSGSIFLTYMLYAPLSYILEYTHHTRTCVSESLAITLRSSQGGECREYKNTNRRCAQVFLKLIRTYS
jgi:hypothetical protein